jgi:hypothetical protein
MMTEMRNRIKEEYQESFGTRPSTKIKPLVKMSDHYPILNLIYCKFCNIYPLSYLGKGYDQEDPIRCKRCEQILEIIPADMYAIQVESYMTNQIMN